MFLAVCAVCDSKFKCKNINKMPKYSTIKISNNSDKNETNLASKDILFEFFVPSFLII